VSVVAVRGLRKNYGSVEAVRGIDFEIEAGEVFGLLGPNGAGKTTTIEILEGYRKRDGGEVEVLGVDPQQSTAALRERLGIVLQSSSLYPNLTVRRAWRSSPATTPYRATSTRWSRSSASPRRPGPACARSPADRSVASISGSRSSATRS
jgi:ABC-type sugar transport system ATPase subunit